MHILNMKNPDDVVKLWPWFTPTKTETRMDITLELQNRLREEPDNVLCLVAILRGIVRAVLISHISDKSKKRVWIWQSRTQPGFSEQKLLFNAVKQWAKGKGCNQLRTSVSDPRWRKVLKRRYGFKGRGKEMRYNVA